MKFIVTTFYYPNFKPLADKTTLNHRAYCEKHGYIYNPYTFTEVPKGNGYQKLCQAGKDNAILALRTLQTQTKADYLFTIGCDALFTNMDLTLEGLVKSYKDFDIVIGTDWDGINASQILVKNSKVSKKYFLEIMVYLGKGGEHEQTFFKENLRKFIHKVPQRVINSYDHELRHETLNPVQHWQVGDFIVHFAGSTLEQRMSVIDKWLGRVN